MIEVPGSLPGREDSLWEEDLHLTGGRCAVLHHPLDSTAQADRYLCRLAGEGLLVDLETLGFVGRPLFLVGMLRRIPETMGWEVLQLLARDYSEEEEVIRAFTQEAARTRRWVSFNGKSFDLPSLKERAAFYRIPVPEPVEHLDLLHAARRLYRGVLPNCRLRTLEQRIFGRVRHRDLDGGEIPGVYHAFVRTGEAQGLTRILQHNQEDLMTLARLWVHILSPESDP